MLRAEEHRPEVFDNRVLRTRLFGSKRNEMTQEGRVLRNEEIYDLYSTNIIRVMKSRRIKWERHVWERGIMQTRFWLDNLRKGDHLENLGVDNFKVDLPEVGCGHGPD